MDWKRVKLGEKKKNLENCFHYQVTSDQKFALFSFKEILLMQYKLLLPLVLAG